jgi:uncharacterized protein YcbX
MEANRVKVVELWRYPVKSFRGERLQSLRFDIGGPEHDRQFMLVDGSPERLGKRLTATQIPALLSHAAAASNSFVIVTTAQGTILRSDDTDFERRLNELVGRPLTLREDRTGANHDETDVLVINAASVRALSEEYGLALGTGRFRGSIVIDGPDAAPYAEELWPGKRLRAGDVELEAIELNTLCSTTTYEPQTLAHDPAFLKFAVRRNGAKFGLFCKVVRPGVMCEGDEWHVAGQA